MKESFMIGTIFIECDDEEGCVGVKFNSNITKGIEGNPEFKKRIISIVDDLNEVIADIMDKEEEDEEH